VEQSLGRRQRERALAQRRLGLYTKRIAVGSGVLAIALSVIAAQSNPGRATPAAPATSASDTTAQGSGGDDLGTSQQGQFDQNAGGGFFGGGGGAPVAVTGGS
jgi:hypothetical protein